VLLQPGQDVGEVKGGPIRGTDGVGEWLEGYGTEVEGEALKRGTGALGLVDSGACAGRVGIFRGPFRVCDLRDSARGMRCYKERTYVQLVGILAHIVVAGSGPFQWSSCFVREASSPILSWMLFTCSYQVVDHGKFRSESPRRRARSLT